MDSQLCAAVRNEGIDFAHKLHALMEENMVYRMTLIRSLACTTDAAFFNQVFEEAIQVFKCIYRWRFETFLKMFGNDGFRKRRPESGSWTSLDT